MSFCFNTVFALVNMKSKLSASNHPQIIKIRNPGTRLLRIKNPTHQKWKNPSFQPGSDTRVNSLGYMERYKKCKIKDVVQNFSCFGEVHFVVDNFYTVYFPLIPLGTILFLISARAVDICNGILLQELIVHTYPHK